MTFTKGEIVTVTTKRFGEVVISTATVESVEPARGIAWVRFGSPGALVPVRLTQIERKAP